MLFSNLLFAVALTVVWPLGMLGLLGFCAWLERRTLVPEEVVPGRLRRMEDTPPEAVEEIVLEETDEVLADHWSTPNHPYLGVAPAPNGRRPAAGEPAPPSVDEPAPLRAVWPREAGEARPPGPAPAPPATPEPVAQAPANPDPPGPGTTPLALTTPEPTQPAGAAPAGGGEAAAPAGPQGPRVTPSRLARLARRRPARGRHERR